MTILIGMHYGNKEGILIASDSKVVMGKKKYQEPKIYKKNNNLIAQCGDDFLYTELMEGISRNIKNSYSSINNIFRDSLISLWKKYTSGEEPLLPEDSFLLSGLLGYYKDKPKLFRFYDYKLEEIINFHVEGIDNGISSLLKKIYYPGISKEKAIEIATYAIIESEENSEGVDNTPQIAWVDKKGACILNEKENSFCFDNPEILKIKEKMSLLYKINNNKLYESFHNRKD